MRGEVISGGLNYQSPKVSLIDSDPGCVEKSARPEIGGEGEISEMKRRVGFRRALDGESIDRTLVRFISLVIFGMRKKRWMLGRWLTIGERN